MPTCSKCNKTKTSFDFPLREGTICKACGKIHVEEYEREAKEARRVKKLEYNKSPKGRDVARNSNHIYRARLNENGPVENISLIELYARDGGVCKICNITLAEDELGSIDHIIPISLGGSHTWDNVQLSHFDLQYKERGKVGL